MTDHICTMLTISTAHLSEETCNEILPRLRDTIPIWAKGECGWFLYAQLEQLGLDADLPADLLRVLEYGQAQGCDYIMLDRDWPVLDHLQSYDW